MAPSWVSGWFVCAALAHQGAAEQIWIDTAATPFRVRSSVHGVLGADGTIRGAGGWEHVDAARRYGADALRTWHVEDLPDVVPTAEAAGLRISAGLWLTHEPARYVNCTDLEGDAWWAGELNTILATVRQFRNSSAILWWTVGNEMELEVNWAAGSECLWRRLEWVAAAVRREDPDHPAGTVFAGLHPSKVQNLAKLCPSIQFLGVNSYGDSSLTVGQDLASAGWLRPYAVLEYGPTGHWASPLTAWGSFVEESSSQKKARYAATCYSCRDDPRCVGAFAFVWGWKWEKTGTWYGMFNDWDAVTENVGANCTACEQETVAAVERCWANRTRASPPPSIRGIYVNGASLPVMRFTVDRQATALEVDAFQPQGHALTAVWAVTEDIVSDAVGGAFESTNPLLTGLWPLASTSTGLGLRVTMNASALVVGRSYRLYVFVREDPSQCGAACPQHEATASLAFHVCHTALPGEECHRHVRYALETGLRVHPQTYPGVNASSSAEEVQMLLHQKAVGACAMPCGLQEWCHTALPGEECHGHLLLAMREAAARPASYPGLTQQSSLESFQDFVFRRRAGVCPRPCSAAQRRPCDPLCQPEAPGGAPSSPAGVFSASRRAAPGAWAAWAWPGLAILAASLVSKAAT